MKKVLIQFAHPAPQKSRINTKMVRAVDGLDNVFINDLYQNYPDFFINIEREQQLLVKHDIIVFQCPMYWYSTPAILKEWQDIVLTRGFAYGEFGNALKGKHFCLAMSLGGSESAYEMGQNGSEGRATVEQLVKPIECMAKLCGMVWQQPLVIYDALHLSPASCNKAAEYYRSYIINQRDGEQHAS
ncbi:MAG: NAD(P)H-dependent oxidoreductase [Pseudomonadota bacterium]|nr:NAD(P)H-dependent oxidoreductase [Pseudomonadota bacterium]